MAEQKGLLKIKGKIGGYSTYYHSPTQKWVVRKNGNRTKKMMMTHKSFERVRENMSEFGLASRIGKSIRQVISLFGKGYTESYFSGRLNSILLKVLQKQNGIRGQRQLDFSQGELLQHVPLDKNALISKCLSANYSLTISSDRTTIDIQNLVVEIISFPEGATHFTITYIAGGISDWVFINDAYVLQYDLAKVTSISKLENKSLASVPLSSSVQLILPEPVPFDAGILVVWGIEFYQEINGSLYLLQKKHGEILGCY